MATCARNEVQALGLHEEPKPPPPPPSQSNKPNLFTHKTHSATLRKRKNIAHIPSTFVLLDGGEWWIRTKQDHLTVYNGLAHDNIMSEGKVAACQRFPPFVMPNISKRHKLYPLFLARCKRMRGDLFDREQIGEDKYRTKYSLLPFLPLLKDLDSVDAGECSAVFDFDCKKCDYDEEEIRKDVELIQQTMIKYGAPKELVIPVICSTLLSEDDDMLGVHIYFPYTRYFIEEVFWLRFILVLQFNRLRPRRCQMPTWPEVIDHKIYTASLRVIGVQKWIRCPRCKETKNPNMSQRRKIRTTPNAALKYIKSKTAMEEDEQQTEYQVSSINSLDTEMLASSLGSLMSEQEKKELLIKGGFAQPKCELCQGVGRMWGGRRYVPRFSMNADGKIDNTYIKCVVADPKILELKKKIKDIEQELVHLTVHNPRYHEMIKLLESCKVELTQKYPGLQLPDRSLIRITKKSTEKEYPRWKEDIRVLYCMLTLLDIRCTFTSRTKYPHTPFCIVDGRSRPKFMSKSDDLPNSWPETWVVFAKHVIELESQTELDDAFTKSRKDNTREKDDKEDKHEEKEEDDEETKKKKQEDKDALKTIELMKMVKKAEKQSELQSAKHQKLIDQAQNQDFKRSAITYQEMVAFSKLREFRKRVLKVNDQLLLRQIEAIQNVINNVITKHNEVTSDFEFGARRVPEWGQIDVDNLLFSAEYASILVKVSGVGSNYCLFKRDFHEGNHIYFILKRFDKGYLKLYQYCLDEDCMDKMKKNVRCWKLDDYKVVALFAPLELEKHHAKKEIEAYFKQNPTGIKELEVLMNSCVAEKRKMRAPQEERKLKRKLQNRIYKHKHGRLGAEYVVNVSDDENDTKETKFVEHLSDAESTSEASENDNDEEEGGTTTENDAKTDIDAAPMPTSIANLVKDKPSWHPMKKFTHSTINELLEKHQKERVAKLLKERSYPLWERVKLTKKHDWWSAFYPTIRNDPIYRHLVKGFLLPEFNGTIDPLTDNTNLFDTALGHLDQLTILDDIVLSDYL